MPLANDHVRTLIELLRASGPELGRRWLAALLVIPEAERPGVVRAVERRVAEEFGRRGAQGEDETLLDVAEPPVQRDGYVEQVIRTYARQEKDRNEEEERRTRRSAS